MRLAIHQSQYLPWPPYVRKLAAADHFVVMDSVQFQRRGVQNRNRIADPERDFWLTVPVSTGSRSDTIADKSLADETWAATHWRSIETAYRRSANWDALAPSLAAVYAAPYVDLLGVNGALLDWLLDVSDVSVPITPLSSLGLSSAKSDLILDTCLALGATTYVSGTGAAGYLDVDAFERAGVAVEFLASEPPVYERGAGRPIPELSLLDMLFHVPVDRVVDHLHGRQPCPSP